MKACACRKLPKRDQLMSESAVDAAIDTQVPATPPSKFDREKRAFFRLLPSLLATHAGQYVAIHDEQVVDSGVDQLEVALRVQRRIGAGAIYVHFVGETPQPICRSGVARESNTRRPDRRSRLCGTD